MEEGREPRKYVEWRRVARRLLEKAGPRTTHEIKQMIVDLLLDYKELQADRDNLLISIAVMDDMLAEKGKRRKK